MEFGIIERETGFNAKKLQINYGYLIQISHLHNSSIKRIYFCHRSKIIIGNSRFSANKDVPYSDIVVRNDDLVTTSNYCELKIILCPEGNLTAILVTYTDLRKPVFLDRSKLMRPGTAMVLMHGQRFKIGRHTTFIWEYYNEEDYIDREDLYIRFSTSAIYHVAHRASDDEKEIQRDNLLFNFWKILKLSEKKMQKMKDDKRDNPDSIRNYMFVYELISKIGKKYGPAMAAINNVSHYSAKEVTL